MLNSPASRWHLGFHSLLINEAMQGKHWEEDVGLLGQIPRAQKHVCFSNTKNLPYPRRNGFNTDRPVLPIVTQKKGSHTWSIRLHPNWFSMSQIRLQIKKTWKRLYLLGIFSKTELFFAVKQAFARFCHGFFQVWGKCCSKQFPTQKVYQCRYTLMILFGYNW